jgi:hypothetical protein
MVKAVGEYACARSNRAVRIAMEYVPIDLQVSQIPG